MKIVSSIFQISVVSLLLILLPVASGAASDKSDVAFKGRSDSGWAILGGYGTSHKGMGKTRVDVETLDLVLRYERILTDAIGTAWYRGHHSFLVELPVHFVVDPSESPMVGMNFLACWNFEGDGTLQPYLFAGGGPVYTDADISGLGAELNGNYQFGAGLRHPYTDENDFMVEYRFHHISNGGREDPNDPLNSSKILFGITF